MKSNKQRKIELKARRTKKAQKKQKSQCIDPRGTKLQSSTECLLADHFALQHNGTYGALPMFYAAKPFECRDCGASEVWTAGQQKWWYEVAKGSIYSTAVRCRSCRNKLKHEKDVQRLHMQAMAEIEPHPNEFFFKTGTRLGQRKMEGKSVLSGSFPYK